MDKKFFVFINILIYSFVVGGMNTLHLGSLGKISALVLGGLFFALVALFAEPVLKFFKFPVNFWGLFFVGILTNLIFFLFFSFGIAPSLLTISSGSFGSELSPLPFPSLILVTNFVTSLLAATFATLLQILTRKIV